MPEKFLSHSHFTCLSVLNGLTDFLHLSLLIIKDVWQKPLLLLSLFFIHGHKLLTSVHWGHWAKRAHPIPPDEQREGSKDKRLTERDLMLSLVSSTLSHISEMQMLSSLWFISWLKIYIIAWVLFWPWMCHYVRCETNNRPFSFFSTPSFPGNV